MPYGLGVLKGREGHHKLLSNYTVVLVNSDTVTLFKLYT